MVLGLVWVAGVGFPGAWALAVAGPLAVGMGMGALFGGFPRGLDGGVLDKDVVVPADEVVGCGGGCRVGGRIDGYGGRRGVPGSRGARRMLGPASNEDEGAGSGIGCVRTLSLVSPVRAGAGSVGDVMCCTW